MKESIKNIVLEVIEDVFKYQKQIKSLQEAYEESQAERSNTSLILVHSIEREFCIEVKNVRTLSKNAEMLCGLWRNKCYDLEKEIKKRDERIAILEKALKND